MMPCLNQRNFWCNKKMEIEDVYKLKRFGTYVLEIDTDERAKIKEFKKHLRRALLFRFIKVIVVPMGCVKLTEIKNKNETSK